MTEKYGAFFDNFQIIVDKIVGLVNIFYDTISKFVEGFKKNITASDEDFEY